LLAEMNLLGKLALKADREELSKICFIV